MEVIVRHLGDAKLRGTAVEALTSYGEQIISPLGELFNNDVISAPIRRQIPRILSRLRFQASADILQECLGIGDLTVRMAVLKALNRLRETAPELKYGAELISKRIRQEAQSYFELYAAITRFRQLGHSGKATALLVRTLEERLRQIINRLFRLLGLHHPPKQIYAAYLAVSHQRSEEFTAALEFLDNILDYELKLILFAVN